MVYDGRLYRTSHINNKINNDKEKPICACKTFLMIIRLSGGFLMQGQLAAQLWDNEDLKAFPIFPSGVRHMLEKIRDQATFPIFLQNFPGDKSTPNLACKTDAVFPKSRRTLS
ncbi:hypothetical protein DVH24_010746 [Malus domestica]|uniref:Uncharacterized protein n=1 Tax=Malus domestica TaxID=3750 RepID=A0A498JZ21_MALDO|nr:hypothetical protein DVH24_010746 [Malus domestica]